MSESANTKKAIADGFRTLMGKKTFEKITISDITSVCGLNRQTFYYHFQDKYDLLNWIFYNDIIDTLTSDYTINTWSDGLLKVLYVFKHNAKFYANALNTSYSDEFRQYLFTATAQLFNAILDIMMQGHKQKLDPDDQQFIAEFLSYGVSGSIINWILTGMKETPENIVMRIKNIINDSKSGTVARYIKDAIT